MCVPIILIDIDMITFNKIGNYGRLGNQLFQIASGIGIARKNNTDFVLPRWSYNVFLKNIVPIGATSGIVYKEKSFEYNNISFDSNLNYDLEGYFQSEKYFKHCENEIRSLFQLKDKFETYVNNKYDFSDTVSMHIRRTDYLNSPDIHPVQSVDYYESAYELSGKSKVIVFSDDLDWCRSNLKFDNIHFSEEPVDILDMFIMSKCENNIIANSSFSWWGAWLNSNIDKKIIAPEKWFGVEATYSDKDIIPDEWIKI